jgi:hypothetical protein
MWWSLHVNHQKLMPIFNILKERWQEKSNVKKKKKKVRRSKTKMDIMEMITTSIERCRAHESVAPSTARGRSRNKGLQLKMRTCELMEQR